MEAAELAKARKLIEEFYETGERVQCCLVTKATDDYEYTQVEWVFVGLGTWCNESTEDAELTKAKKLMEKFDESGERVRCYRVTKATDDTERIQLEWILVNIMLYNKVRPDESYWLIPAGEDYELNFKLGRCIPLEAALSLMTVGDTCYTLI